MDINAVWNLLDGAPLWTVFAIYLVLGIAAALTARMIALSAVKTIRALASQTGTGSGIFYAAAVAGMFVSLNTSWNFFGEKLDVQNLVERGVMFFVLELAQLACGWGMRTSIQRTTTSERRGTPGPARWVAWALCGMSAYMAWELSGFWVGVARVMLGPVLSLVMLHLALGIEVRGLTIRKDSTWMRLAHEFRERFLSLFGLGDEGRDAKTIAQERALARAIRIRMTKGDSPKAAREFIQNLSKAGIMGSPEKLEQFNQGMQLAANAAQVYGQKYDMPAGLVVARAETETVLDAEIVETGTETSQVNDAETPAETKKPVALTVHSRETEAQIETLLQFMRERGYAKAIEIPEAQQVLGLSRATAARRLAAARDRFNAAS